MDPESPIDSEVGKMTETIGIHYKKIKKLEDKLTIVLSEVDEDTKNIVLKTVKDMLDIRHAIEELQCSILEHKFRKAGMRI